jgi:hypothetical protein
MCFVRRAMFHVIGAAAQSAHDFFDKSYITKGMETLLSQGLQRLGGRSDQAVFELKQAMGGGKTHSPTAPERGPDEPKTPPGLPPTIIGGDMAN